jgi:hypothetical protein
MDLAVRQGCKLYDLRRLSQQGLVYNNLLYNMIIFQGYGLGSARIIASQALDTVLGVCDFWRCMRACGFDNHRIGIAFLRLWAHMNAFQANDAPVFVPDNSKLSHGYHLPK